MKVITLSRKKHWRHTHIFQVSCMKNIALIALCALAPATSWAAIGKCGFLGKFKKTKISKKNSFCTVERSGSKRYLLVRIKKKGGWLWDISGLIDKPGTTTLRLKAMGPGGFRGPRSKRYNAKKKVKVSKIKGMKNGRKARVKATLKSSDGKKIKLSGFFVWTVDSTPKEIVGRMKARFDKIDLKTKQVKFTPWHSRGYQVMSLYVVKPGETITLTVNFPDSKSGTYTEKQKARLTAAHSTYIDGKLTLHSYSGKRIKMVVTRDKDVIKLSYAGKLTSNKGKTIDLVGAFAGRISK